MTLHVAPAYGDSSESIVIVEPTSPGEVAELLTRAHGLSPRERDVALGLTRGETTDALASRLGVSSHTVRDHLKAAFRKTGTTSRTELVAHLFASWYAAQLFDVDPHRDD